MRQERWDDYRYSQSARDADLKVIWKCSACRQEREDYPGFNEGGTHSGCGGEWESAGESYRGRE